MDNTIEKAKNSSTFCIYPFTHMATKTDGEFKLCCRSEPIGSVKTESFREAWNNEKVKKARQMMMRSEKPPECEACWKMEETGARSMRMRALQNTGKWGRWETTKDSLKHYREDGTLDITPKSVELKISNLCNLKCRMCHPLDSTLWAKDWPAVEDMMEKHNRGTYHLARQLNVVKKPLLSEFVNNKQWWDDIESLVDHLEIVEFAGGEPLIDPVHFRLLDMFQRRAPEIDLKYSTNLTKLSYRGQDVTKMWSNFKSVEVYASIDGIHDVYEYIRTGGRFADVENNLKVISSNRNFNLSEAAIACTIQIYNAFQILDIAEYFLKMGIKFHTHTVTWPQLLNVQVLPKYAKDILTEQTIDWMKRTPNNETEEYFLPRTKGHLNDFVNFMNGEDKSHLLPAFCEYTRRLDKVRETDARKISPILRQIMDSHPPADKTQAELTT